MTQLRKLAHAIYIDFFFLEEKIENFIGKNMIFFLIFSFKTYIVGTR